MIDTEPVSDVRRVLIFAPAFEPGFKAGGPIKSMVQILDNLPRSVEVTLVTGDRDQGDTVPYPGLSGRSVRRGQHEVNYLNWRDARQWVSLLRRLRRTRHDLMYVNSLWSPPFTVVPVVSRCLGLLSSREMLLAPRGELSPGALTIKARKKQRFLRVWRPLLRMVDPVWHASTEMEERDISHAFSWARTVVHGHSRGDDPVDGIVSAVGDARFVFISRISKMKNLVFALEALQLVTSDVELDIYGPVEDVDHWAECQRLIAAMRGNVRVTYRGTLRPDEVQAIFTGYDAFILPTLGENFGHIIGESLSAGCPVVCSTNSPWTPVLQQGGGAALHDFDPRVWAAELDRRASLSSWHRDADKKAALDAYVEWRRHRPSTSAVELVLARMAGQEMTRGQGRRVALVTQGFQTAGGIQTAARWLAASLRSAGHEVVVFDLASSRADPHSRRLTSPSSWRRTTLTVDDPVEAQMVHVGANGVELEPLRYLPRKDLSVELDRFDVVQVVAGGPALALTTVRSRRPTVLQVATTVAWERSSQLSVTTRNLARWRTAMTWATSRLERAALRRVDTVLVMNREMADFVGSVCETRVVMAPPGIDTDRFTPRPEGWDPQGYLLSVCRLDDPRKGLDRMIRAYALMVELLPSVPRLVLAGRGTLPSAQVQLVAELALVSRVDIRSDVPWTELPSLFRGSSVYLQASHEEGLGISVLEAMASGVPVVATDTAGTGETVVHGETGWLIDQTSEVVAGFARRVVSIWQTGGQSMALNARDRATELFSDQASLSRILDVYDTVIDGRLRAAP